MTTVMHLPLFGRSVACVVRTCGATLTLYRESIIYYIKVGRRKLCLLYILFGPQREKMYLRTII